MEPLDLFFTCAYREPLATTQPISIRVSANESAGGNSWNEPWTPRCANPVAVRSRDLVQRREVALLWNDTSGDFWMAEQAVAAIMRNAPNINRCIATSNGSGLQRRGPRERVTHSGRLWRAASAASAS